MLTKKEQKFIEEDIESLPFSGDLYKKNQRRISVFKLTKVLFLSISFLAVVVIVVYGVFLTNKTNAESITQDTVLTQLSKQIILPDQELLSVKRVFDAKTLASQEDFYKNLKNGDYIIVYKHMVLLYDFDDSIIKNVKTY